MTNDWQNVTTCWWHVGSNRFRLKLKPRQKISFQVNGKFHKIWWRLVKTWCLGSKTSCIHPEKGYSMWWSKHFPRLLGTGFFIVSSIGVKQIPKNKKTSMHFSRIYKDFCTAGLTFNLIVIMKLRHSPHVSRCFRN